MRILTILSLAAVLWCPSTAAAEKWDPHWRQPVDVVCHQGRAYVANLQSGSISVVDLRSRTVLDEMRVGHSISSIAKLPGGVLLATDQQRHRLLVLEPTRGPLRVVKEIDVARYPVAVEVSADGNRVAVSSLWSRRLTLFDVTGKDAVPELLPAHVLDLPFAPRHLWLAPDAQRVVVADAFGDLLAVVDASQGRLHAVRRLHGHQVGGIALADDGASLLLSHQMLNDSIFTTEDGVFWGNVMGNVLRNVPLSELDPAAPTTLSGAQSIGHWYLLPLGEPGHGTGDPAGVWVGDRGQTIVCLGGVNEIAVRPSPRQPMIRYPVGTRPTAVTADATTELAVVTHLLDDSLTLVDLQTMRVTGTLSLGPTPEITSVDRGRRLFYDARLSLDGWFSCQSCHVDGHTNGLRSDNTGDDSFGAPKRVLSLLGVADTGPWAWRGNRDSLRSQIHGSILSTMRSDDQQLVDEDLMALESYVMSLSPPPSLAEARQQRNSLAEQRGQAVFESVGCADCHAPPVYTVADTFDVGLADELGVREFNPPSLRGVSQRGPYFHDGRAVTLEAVFREHQHAEITLDDQQRADLLKFLESL